MEVMVAECSKATEETDDRSKEETDDRSEEETDDRSEKEPCSRPRRYDRKEIYCPFTWNECCRSLKAPSSFAKVNDKLSPVDISPWHKYCYQMLLSCIHIRRKEEENAFTLLKSCSDILISNKNENFFKEILEGLEHVLLSCELFLYVEKEDNESARTIFSQIKSFHVLNQVCQAAVLAVKACILGLFGKEAQQEGLKCIKRAIELDPDELGIRKGAWYCLAGRTLAETRNNLSHHQMPSLEERQFLERSIEKDPFPIHYVYLADTYRQIAKMLLQLSFKNNKEEADEMSEKARKMYEDAINDENATVSSLTRSGIGLIKLQKQFRNVELAKFALDKVLSIDPNHTAALIGMANLMHWCMNDYKEALKYFERASLSQPVGGNIIKMKSLIHENYNPLEDCDKYFEKEMEMNKGLQREGSTVYFHVVKAEYFLVKNKDLMEAARCWEKAISSFPLAKEIWEYQCLFAKDKRSKLSKMLVDEINLALKQRIDKEDVEYFKKILRLCNASSEDSSNTTRK